MGRNMGLRHAVEANAAAIEANAAAIEELGGGGCERIPVLFSVDEIAAGEFSNAVGFGLESGKYQQPLTLQHWRHCPLPPRLLTHCAPIPSDTVPFYDPETGEQLGVYSDFSTETSTSDECLIQGFFTWVTQDNGFDEYASQLNLQSTCTSKYNSIVGGNGMYGCASGYEGAHIVYAAAELETLPLRLSSN